MLGALIHYTVLIAPVVVTAAFWVGSSGVGRMAGVSFGPIVNKGHQSLYRGLIMGASALQAATFNGVRSGANGKNGDSAAQEKLESARTAVATGLAPNHAKRP